MEIDLIAAQLTQLEYQLDNKGFMTAAQAAQVQSKYDQGVRMLSEMIALQAKEMHYPQSMEQWADSKPMEVLNDLSGGTLASTWAYQALLSTMT